MHTHIELRSRAAFAVAQASWDAALPAEDADEALEPACNEFADEAINGQLSPADFHNWANDSRVIYDIACDDSDSELLQLVIKASQIPELEPFAKRIIERVRQDAYAYREKELKEPADDDGY